MLVAAVLLRALGWAAAMAAAGIGVFALVDWLAPLPIAVRTGVVPAAVIAAVVTGMLLLVWGRHALRLDRVALFVEERVPALEYALVTALGAAASVQLGELERMVERAQPNRAVRRPVVRAVMTSLSLFAAALLLQALLPRAARERVLAPRAGDLLLGRRNAGPAASRLAPLVARVIPPAYARQAPENLDDPLSVRALVGSWIEVRGRGASRGALDRLSATIGPELLQFAAVGDTWSVALVMPEKPEVIRLVDRGYNRLLILEPVPDAPPTAMLISPARDTTYSVPRGALALAGQARDDIGLARVEFELMHTTGSGERFEARGFTLGAASPSGARAAEIHSALLLDTMRLGPGDVLHIRIVARDENNLGGPGEGASDTRTIRIADPSARDTIVVVAAAMPALDTTMLSQRTLILRAETLWVRRPRLAPATYESQGRMLGGLQAQLRSRVEQVIDDLETITDVGFMGRTETSNILRQAASAMRQAERRLSFPDVQGALPHMYRALRALEQARNADRLYLRGIFPKIVLDLERVRLKGTDKAAPGERTPRPAIPDPRRTLLVRLDRALALAGNAPGPAGDSLVMIRVAALTDAPDAAATLARAIDALRRGADPAPAGLAARRLLLRETEATPSLSGWRRAP